LLRVGLLKKPGPVRQQRKKPNQLFKVIYPRFSVDFRNARLHRVWGDRRHWSLPLLKESLARGLDKEKKKVYILQLPPKMGGGSSLKTGQRFFAEKP
jgi:hypothetical protein